MTEKEQRENKITELKKELAKLEEPSLDDAENNKKIDDSSKINIHYRLEHDELSRMLTDYVSKYWIEHPDQDMTKCYFVIDRTGKISKHNCSKNATMPHVSEDDGLPVIHRKRKH